MQGGRVQSSMLRIEDSLGGIPMWSCVNTGKKCCFLDTRCVEEAAGDFLVVLNKNNDIV